MHFNDRWDYRYLAERERDASHVHANAMVRGDELVRAEGPDAPAVATLTLKRQGR